MAITRITAQWTGFRGGPGYSNFFFDGAFTDEAGVEAAGLAVADFFTAFRDEFPSGLSITVQPTADLVDEASGQIMSVLDFAAPPAVLGSDSRVYSAATGAVVNWNTQDYVNGRRVRGRTFLVPLSSGAFDGTGDLDAGALGKMRLSANGLVEAALENPLCVWHRPVNGAGGSSHVVTNATIPDLGAVLRSRRD